MPTHYEALGVPKTATVDEIRAAWRSAAKEHHPDVQAGRAARGSSNYSTPAAAEAAHAGATARFVAARDAYTILSDPDARAAYDRSQERPKSAWEEERDRAYAPSSYGPPPTPSWQRGDPYPGRQQAHQPYTEPVRPTTRYADRVEDPSWWQELYETRSPSGIGYTGTRERRVDYDLDQIDLELRHADRFAFDARGTTADGRRIRNPFRSFLRKGGKVGG